MPNLNNQIRFTEIPQLVEAAMENISGVEADSIDTVLSADAEARRFVLGHVAEKTG